MVSALGRKSKLESQGNKAVTIFEWDSFPRKGGDVARKVIEMVTCDPCAKTGVEQEATTELTIMGDSYDLCEPHGEKFRGYFKDLLGSAVPTAKSA